MPNVKRVYTFGNKKAEGNGKMRELLGGKGANLAEMNLVVDHPGQDPQSGGIDHLTVEMFKRGSTPSDTDNALPLYDHVSSITLRVAEKIAVADQYLFHTLRFCIPIWLDEAAPSSTRFCGNATSSPQKRPRGRFRRSFSMLPMCVR